MREQVRHSPLFRRFAVAGGALGVAIGMAATPAHAQAQAQRDTTKKDSAAATPLLKAVRDSGGGLSLQSNSPLKDGMVVKLNGQKWNIMMAGPGKADTQADTGSTKADTSKAVADTVHAVDSTKAKHSSP